MSDRDVITAHERVPGMRLATCMCGWEEPIRGRDVTALHAAHVAAALRGSRTVWTVEELDALPAGTVVWTGDDQVWQRLVGQGVWAWDCLSEDGSGGPYDHNAVLYAALPPQVRVLHRPDGDGAL